METLWPLNMNILQIRTNVTSDESFSSRYSMLRRLATFGSSSSVLHPTLTKGSLAKLGFFKIKDSSTIKCEECQFEIESSTTADNLITEHMKHSPQCYFVRQQSNILCTYNKSSNESSRTNNSSHVRSTHAHTGTNLSSDTANPHKKFLDCLSEKTLDDMRSYTFANWPLITPSANEMINSGWSYTNISDRVICIHCDALYHKWTETDRPYEIHRLKSPHCRFVRLAERRTIGTATNANAQNTPELMTEAAIGTVNSAYAIPSRRYDSFDNWPHAEGNPLPPVQAFVDAGFYYTGKSTSVRCFYCHGALQNWVAGDDPKVEHARWYPQCDYIRQYIGKDLYEAIQRKNKELKAQQNNSKQAMPWDDSVLDKMVKARLDLPFVEKLRNIGFSMAIIKKALEMQLKFKKDDFRTDNDFYLACLILNLQVKLINGNEANLLVPKEWLENFSHEQPEQQQSQLEVPQAEPMETEKIENKPTSVQTKTSEQSVDISTACIICMEAERQVACLPCGHLSSCVACGHSLKTCPICRTPVKAFVRIYI